MLRGVSRIRPRVLLEHLAPGAEQQGQQLILAELLVRAQLAKEGRRQVLEEGSFAVENDLWVTPRPEQVHARLANRPEPDECLRGDVPSRTLRSGWQPDMQRDLLVAWVDRGETKKELGRSDGPADCPDASLHPIGNQGLEPLNQRTEVRQAHLSADGTAQVLIGNDGRDLLPVCANAVAERPRDSLQLLLGAPSSSLGRLVVRQRQRRPAWFLI